MICRKGRVIKAPPLQVMEIPLGHGEVFRDFHPVPLCFKVSMHRRRLEPRVAPEPYAPPEETGDHQDQWYHDPLRHSSFCRPEEADQRKRGFPCVGALVQVESAMGDMCE